jgi:VanZ family protein
MFNRKRSFPPNEKNTKFRLKGQINQLRSHRWHTLRRWAQRLFAAAMDRALDPSHMVRLVRPAFWLAAAFALVMALLPRPPKLPTGLWGDKVEHIIAFVVLTALAVVAYRQAPKLRIVAGLSLFGAVIELGQTVPALNRDADLRDWIADTAAVLVVVAIAALVERVRVGPGR